MSAQSSRTSTGPPGSITTCWVSISCRLLRPGRCHGIPIRDICIFTVFPRLASASSVPGCRTSAVAWSWSIRRRRPAAVHRRIQDPGAATLILLVRDIDAAFAPLQRAGVRVVTTGGAPISMSAANKTRAVIVQDPDGHFVELVAGRSASGTTVPASSNVIGIRLRVTVADVERTAAYYEKVLGVHWPSRPFVANRNVMAMIGLPDAGEYRLVTAQLPGSALTLEFIEFKGLIRRRPRCVARSGSGLLPSAAHLPRHRRDARCLEPRGQPSDFDRRCPGEDDVWRPAVAADRRPRPQQPVSDRAARSLVTKIRSGPRAFPAV